MAEDTAVSADLTYRKGENTVTLTLSHTRDTSNLLGCEILRNGEAVAFVSPDETSYTDTITTRNNRAYQYQVSLITSC